METDFCGLHKFESFPFSNWCNISLVENVLLWYSDREVFIKDQIDTKRFQSEALTRYLTYDTSFILHMRRSTRYLIYRVSL